MTNIANISFNKEEGRYELHIGGKLKAYTQDDHELGLSEIVKMVEEKGYVAIIEQ